ncbi:hypothetical protein PFISCL1PPCAC_22775, partial [Pristionchus fissidentatus]
PLQLLQPTQLRPLLRPVRPRPSLPATSARRGKCAAPTLTARTAARVWALSWASATATHELLAVQGGRSLPRSGGCLRQEGRRLQVLRDSREARFPLPQGRDLPVHAIRRSAPPPPPRVTVCPETLAAASTRP